VKQSFLKDLRERCYLVNDAKSLDEVMDSYSSGNLSSKWSERIIDEYAFPLDQGNPGKNIAAYIRQRILSHGQIGTSNPS